MFKHVLGLLLLCWMQQVCADDQEMTDAFAHQQVQGTMVLSALKADKTFIYNPQRAQQRLAIASTFKILNTLIAVQEKIVTSKDDIFKWNGQHYDFSDWNHDQTLSSAFKVSCVWCYQDIAQHVGAERYKNYIQQLHYGQLREPFNGTTFWLDGSLQISALEQVEFLKKIYQKQLPFSPLAYQILQDIMVAEQTPHYVLRAKTGWAARVNPQVGWYVGYVETANEVWFFATNILITSDKDLPLRQAVTREVLQKKHILD